MKKLNYFLAVGIVVMSCQLKQADNTTEIATVAKNSISQNPTSESGRKLIVGSDPAQNMSCPDSCEITYQDYTVDIKAHQEAVGESITITNHKTKAQYNIEIKEAENAQYFNGLLGNIAMIDFGTGSIRDLAIYDLQTQKVLTILKGLVNDASITDGKLSYATLMSAQRVKELKLPACSNPNLEISGYAETMNFDFVTNKTVSTQKYDCIK